MLRWLGGDASAFPGAAADVYPPHAAKVSAALVTSAGNVVNSYDNVVILEDDIDMDELYNGASATGCLAFLIPDGETALIRVRPGVLADEVFVQP